MSYQYTSSDDHFLRKFFDTVYGLTPANLQRVVSNTPKRVRWMIASTIAGLVLAFVILQLTNIGIKAYEEATRPTQAELLEAPYGLSTRIVPAIQVTDRMSSRETPIVDGISAATDADAAVAAAWQVAAQYGEHINEDWVRANFEPIVDYSYFFILPEFPEYTRSYVRNDLAAHPTTDCFLGVARPTSDCGLAVEPNFIEAADYFGTVDANGRQPHARMLAMQFSDAQTAREVIRGLSYDADRKGGLGNYAMGNEQPVSYMSATGAGRQLFIWANQNWMFMISSQSINQIESMIGNFYH